GCSSGCRSTAGTSRARRTRSGSRARACRASSRASRSTSTARRREALIELRAASLDDAPELARIARAALPEGWSEASLRDVLGRAGACALVTEPLRGFVLGDRVADEAEILTLAVERE